MAVSKARESTDSIEKLYITMRHLSNKGTLKPSGFSGQALRTLLLKLNPEIYGSMADKNKVELNGLLYVVDRLPEGVEKCAYIHLTSNEGYEKSSFTPIVPKKRRRNCYRINEDQMNIEILLGRSEIYDILTHLTFLYMEADKLRARLFENGEPMRSWRLLEEAASRSEPMNRKEREVALIHLASVLGRTFDETLAAYKNFSEENNPDRIFKIMYSLAKVSNEDLTNVKRREIIFSSILMERVGHHLFGEKWALNIKKQLLKLKLHTRPLHIISANMHSVCNMLFAFKALGKTYKPDEEIPVYQELSNNTELREKVTSLIHIRDTSGSNIEVQIIDLSEFDLSNTPFAGSGFKGDDVLMVMDYAFGEQAFEVIDEFLKPINDSKTSFYMNIKSISIMGKAGILVGEKGDIMIPNAHIFEGTADNYPFKNALKKTDFNDNQIKAFEGPMITALGTSLQNKDILCYFRETSWKAIGLEMEGAHYQKAIQIASKIRGHIEDKVTLRYAYYASDNPLETGSTLASGGLGLTGVKPTYMITQKMLEQILI